MRNKKFKASPQSQTLIAIQQKWRECVIAIEEDDQVTACDNKSIKALRDALVKFTSSNTTIEDQMQAIRAIAQHLSTMRSTKTATHKDCAVLSKIILSAVIPICTAAFFSDAEQSARTALLSVFSRIHEVETAILHPTLRGINPNALFDALKAAFEANLSHFLDTQTEFVSAATFDWSRVSSVCLVLLNTVDWSVGISVVLRSLENNVLSFCRLLTNVKTAIDSSVDGAEKEDALVLSQKTRACHDILKTLASLFAKLGNPETKPFSFLAPGGPHAEAGQLLLTQSIQITFSDPKIYFRDCQFMAGIVAGWVLETTSHLNQRAWIGPVFFGQVAEKGSAISQLKGLVGQALDDPESFYPLLCFLRGILTTIGTEAPLIQHGNISLFSELYKMILKVIQVSSDSATRVLAFQTLATWMAILKDSLVQGQPTPAGVSILAVFETSFDLVFTFWEDPVDSMQHKLKDVFVAMLEIIAFFRKSGANQEGALDSKEASFLFEIVDNLLKADWQRKVKYDLLAHLLLVIRPEEILKLRSDFLITCFDVMSNLSMSSRISSLLIRFFSALFSSPESLTPHSSITWLKPFCYALSNPSIHLRRAVSESLVGLVFKDHKSHFEMLLHAFEEAAKPVPSDSGVAINMEYHLHGSICVLKTGRMLGFLEPSFLNQTLETTSEEDAVFTRSVVHSAIGHPDANIRMDVCGLLCDSARALAEPGVEELEFVKLFLSVNAADSRSEFRQKLFGNVHKLIFRIRKCLYANQRVVKERGAFLAKNAGSAETRDEATQLVADAQQKIAVKMGFLNWLMEFAVISLSPGSSFPRTTSALVLLSTIRDAEEMPLDSTFNKGLSSEFSTFHNASCAAALTSILLNDTYEPSRQSAFGLLMSMKGDLPGFGEAEVQKLLDQGLKMLFSVKSSDSDGGAFVFRLVFCKYVMSGNRFFQISQDFEEVNSKYEAQAAFVVQLLSLIRKHVAVIEQDLADSITEFPVHGLFSALRSVLGEVKYASSRQQPKATETWNQILKQTYTLIHRATHSVLAVLSDESPEGNFPGLNEAEGAQEMDAIMVDAGGDKTSKSQRILHECFRVVKEACAALEVVLCRVPLPERVEKQDEFLEYETIVAGGDWLRLMLTSIRHFGAFSGVFTCFQSLCATLLCSKKQFLVTLPQSWLTDFLQKAEQMDVSITRRSGGLPLGVLAVLGSNSPYRSSLLDQTMTRLFAMAGQPVPLEADANLDLPQVHSFNIVRRLLMDATITDLMRGYFAECFVLSIDGLTSSSFPIRNCATMLFSSLVTKVIGVKKSKDQDHAINTVSGREFFARFPRLHSFMMEKLQSAVLELNGENHTVHPAFYPILTILSRLKPTALEANTSHLTLQTFRPLVEQCASSSFFKVREVTARAFASLIPPTEFVETVERLMAGLTPTACAEMNANEVHGKLMMVRNLIQMHLLREAPAREIAMDFASKIPNMIESSKWILSDCRIPAIQDVYIGIAKDVFIESNPDVIFTHPITKPLFQSVWKMAVHLFTETNTPSMKSAHPWTFLLRQNLAHFVLDSLSFLSPDRPTTDIVLFFLNDPDYEVQLQALAYLNTAKSVDWAKITPRLVSLVHTKSTYEQVAYIAARICCLPNVQESLYSAGMSAQCSPVVSVPEDFAERLSVTENTYEVETVLPLLASIVMNGPDGFTNDGVTVLLGLMRKWSSEETAVYVRISVVNALALVLPKLEVNEQNESLYVDLLLQLEVLLDDDDSDVRAAAAEIVGYHLNKEPMIPSQCRASLFAHALRVAKSDQSKAKIAEYAVNMLLGNVDAATLLEAQINPTHVLFAKEESNQNKEEVVDAVLAFRIITSLFESDHNAHLKAKIQHRLLEWCSESIGVLEANAQSLDGLKGRGKMFGLGARIAVGLMVIVADGGSEGDMEIDGGSADAAVLVGRISALDVHSHILAITQKGSVVDAVMDLFPRLV
ncbi:hypothetical protein HDU98_006506 [Podochytrium sp. JEL0797]|nr:hypothetical protein HDU98_006506 [Podochytrium sp. JEL0797]